MPLDLSSLETLLAAAVEITDETQRAAYIDRACAGDALLRAELQSMVHDYFAAASLIDRPAVFLATIDQPAAECVGTLIGPYKLLEQIGEGGMGIVYMAEQQRPLRRLVALKLVKPGMDSKQVIARFEAERQALAMMDHPNIAKILDAGTVGEKDEGGRIKDEGGAGSSFSPHPSSFPSAARPYFVMELVRGIPINEFCDQKRLTVRERLQLFIQVCQAVQHAHQKGIIHRDLKPTNVLVTLADTVAFPKLLDFGIAKALGQSLTDSTLHTGYSQLVGTPLYMSPEQAEMNLFGVDTRSDVYSLGVLLYELLTGTTPFDKEKLTKASFDEMRRIIREEEPETVSARIARTRNDKPGVDARVNRRAHAARSELDWIVMKALEKDRSRRYESASALATDIQRYLSDEPVLACPPTTMYRFQKFARKHRPVLVTAAAIAACLMLGTTVSAWQAVRATQAEAQANANEQKAVANAAAAQEKEQEAVKQRDEVKTLADELRRTLYASNMNLAKHSWDAGGVGRVRELLDQHRPKAGESDLRGFEWHYLNRLCHSDLLTLQHTGEVNGVAYSPDGKRLAASSKDKTVKLWDSETGKELLTFKDQSAWGVVFSPDGKRLASGVRTGPEGEGKVRDVQTGEELFSLQGGFNSFVFSADGKRLAGSGEKVKIWDAQTGKELHTIEGSYESLAFSPDGKRLAGGGSDVKVWDAQTGQELLKLKAYSWYPQSLAYSPDGQRLASVSGDTTVNVWNAQTGQDLLSLEFSGASGVSFSSDGKHLAAGSWRGIARVWDIGTGQVVRTFRGSGSIVVFSPDGQRLASNVNSAVKIWDAHQDQEVSSHPNIAALLSPDGKLSARASADNAIKIQDAVTGQEILSLKGHTVPIWVRAFSPDGKRLASGGGGSSDHGVSKRDRAELKIWDVQTGTELFNLPVANGTVNKLAFSPDGKRLASMSGPTTVPAELKVWDVATGQELLALKGHTAAGSGMVYSPDGKHLASASTSSTVAEVKLWDAQTGQELFSLNGPGGAPMPLVFSSDGKRLACGGNNGVKVWDAGTGQEILVLKGHASNVRGVAFSQDGTRLATSSNDQTVKLWDAHTGKELLSLDAQWPTKVAFSPNGYRLTVNGDGNVKTYDATPLPQKP